MIGLDVTLCTRGRQQAPSRVAGKQGSREAGKQGSRPTDRQLGGAEWEEGRQGRGGETGEGRTRWEEGRQGRGGGRPGKGGRGKGREGVTWGGRPEGCQGATLPKGVVAKQAVSMPPLPREQPVAPWEKFPPCNPHSLAFGLSFVCRGPSAAVPSGSRGEEQETLGVLGGEEFTRRKGFSFVGF